MTLGLSRLIILIRHEQGTGSDFNHILVSFVYIHLGPAFNLPGPVQDDPPVGAHVVLALRLQHAQQVALPVPLLRLLVLELGRHDLVLNERRKRFEKEQETFVLSFFSSLTPLWHLHSLFQNGSPVHEEVSANAGRPDVLTGPDVAQDVGSLGNQDTRLSRHVSKPQLANYQRLKKSYGFKTPQLLTKVEELTG